MITETLTTPSNKELGANLILYFDYLYDISHKKNPVVINLDGKLSVLGNLNFHDIKRINLRRYDKISDKFLSADADETIVQFLSLEKVIKLENKTVKLETENDKLSKIVKEQELVIKSLQKTVNFYNNKDFLL